jgi:transcriptional regulator with XRE-family HTH domain
MNHEIYVAFAKRLNQICDEMHLPDRGRQAELARICEVKPSSVNKWFSAISLPDAENLLKIADWAGTTSDWLLFGRGPRHAGAESTMTPKIHHVVKILGAMPEFKVDQAIKIVDTLAEPAPPANGTSPSGKHK